MQTKILSSTPSDEICVNGSLEDWSLPELLSWLHSTRRSAMLRIGSGLDAGVCFFDRGRLFRVEYMGMAGEEALMELLGINAGGYQLIQRELPRPASNVELETPRLFALTGVSRMARERGVIT